MKETVIIKRDSTIDRLQRATCHVCGALHRPIEGQAALYNDEKLHGYLCGDCADLGADQIRERLKAHREHVLEYADYLRQLAEAEIEVLP